MSFSGMSCHLSGTALTIPDRALAPTQDSRRNRRVQAGAGCQSSLSFELTTRWTMRPLIWFVVLAVVGSSGAPDALSAAPCSPSATHRVYTQVTVGNGPVRAGSTFGERAIIDVWLRPSDDRYVGKLFWLIARKGPASVRVRAERIDTEGVAHLVVAAGKPDGDAVILQRSRIARKVIQRDRRWIGAPGEINMPAPGCYRLRARWAGGGWTATIRARSGSPRADQTGGSSPSP
jgi:hypothetical protein